jgi:rSAM/selenodomain-associated transferase 2
MPSDNALSVVIPCWRDEAALVQLLQQLDQLRGERRLQVLVVDAAQSEQCRQICQRHGAEWLSAQPCRGEQLRMGAARAEHPIIWFLHADAQLHGDPLGELQRTIAAGAVGGYFRFRFAGPPSWRSRLLERLIAWRNRFGVPYGDQGIFASRQAYHAAGQHSPWPLFEEVELIRNLRRIGSLSRVDQGLLVDTRRWNRDGWWKRSLHNRLLALAHLCGVSPFTLVRLYQRKKRDA